MSTERVSRVLGRTRRVLGVSLEAVELGVEATP